VKVLVSGGDVCHHNKTLIHKTADLNDRDFLVRNLHKKTYQLKLLLNRAYIFMFFFVLCFALLYALLYVFLTVCSFVSFPSLVDQAAHVDLILINENDDDDVCVQARTRAPCSGCRCQAFSPTTGDGKHASTSTVTTTNARTSLSLYENMLGPLSGVFSHFCRTSMSSQHMGWRNMFAACPSVCVCVRGRIMRRGSLPGSPSTSSFRFVYGRRAATKVKCAKYPQVLINIARITSISTSFSD